MRNYRLYRLDGAGKIVGAEWLSAEDDDDATGQARALAYPSTVEIWDRNRMVVRLVPSRDAED